MSISSNPRPPRTLSRLEREFAELAQMRTINAMLPRMAPCEQRAARLSRDLTPEESKKWAAYFHQIALVGSPTLAAERADISYFDLWSARKFIPDFREAELLLIEQWRSGLADIVLSKIDEHVRSLGTLCVDQETSSTGTDAEGNEIESTTTIRRRVRPNATLLRLILNAGAPEYTAPPVQELAITHTPLEEVFDLDSPGGSA